MTRLSPRVYIYRNMYEKREHVHIRLNVDKSDNLQLTSLQTS